MLHEEGASGLSGLAGPPGHAERHDASRLPFGKQATIIRLMRIERTQGELGLTSPQRGLHALKQRELWAQRT